MAQSFAMTRAEREAFLREPHIAVLSLNDPGHGPLAAPVWYDVEESGDVFFLTSGHSRKGRLIVLETRLTLTVQSETAPYRYVSIEGPVTALDSYDADHDLKAMATRYRGAEAAAEFVAARRDALPHENPLRVTMCPERWLTTDYAKR